MKKLIDDALALLARARDSEDFRAYLQQRQPLILAAGLVMGVVSLACAGGVATFFASLRTWMTLPALIVGAMFLVVSMALQLYVFFSWLEGRALARALGHRADLGPVPAIPWPLVAAVLFLPLLLLAVTAPVSTLVIIAIGAATPIMFARFESALLQRPQAGDGEPDADS